MKGAVELEEIELRPLHRSRNNSQCHTSDDERESPTKFLVHTTQVIVA